MALRKFGTGKVLQEQKPKEASETATTGKWGKKDKAELKEENQK